MFVLDAGDITNVVARRQVLPRVGGTGLPGNRGTGIPEVVPTGGSGENSYGVFGTPAVHAPLGRLFVGVGGYNGMALDEGGGDPTRTPFVRALNWNDLHDAWPTAVGPDNVIRYTSTKPPMYLTREVGLSSPAVVSDVVFVATSPQYASLERAHLYALSALDGHCLWSASGLAQGAFTLGPAIYGNYVVVGAGSECHDLRLGPRWRFPIPWEWYRAVAVGAVAAARPIPVAGTSPVAGPRARARSAAVPRAAPGVSDERRDGGDRARPRRGRAVVPHERRVRRRWRAARRRVGPAVRRRARGRAGPAARRRRAAHPGGSAAPAGQRAHGVPRRAARVRGRAPRRITRLNGAGVREPVLSDLPGPGNYHTNMTVIGPDEKLYFSQGAMTNSGIVGLDAYEIGWLRRFHMHTTYPGPT